MIEKPISILNIEDSVSDSDLILRLLKKSGMNVFMERVDNAMDMRQALITREWDLLISDFSMPQFDGFTALKLLQEMNLDIPFIAVSGTMGEETAVSMMKAGAHDYIMKNNLSRLPPAVERELAAAEILREKKNMRIALEQNEARLRTVVQTIPDLIWLKDPDGVYLACNYMFERFFGATEAEILGKTDYDFVSEELANLFRSNDLLAQEKDGPNMNEEWVTFAEGGNRALLETIKTPLKSNDGRLLGVLGIARDITERHKLVGELIEAKEKAEASDRLKAAFMNIISHEIRTPLNGILGFGELIIEPGITQEDKQQYLDILKKSSDRLLNTITNYIDISLLVSGNQDVTPRPVHLNLFLNELQAGNQSTCDAKNIRLSHSYPDGTDDLLISADPVLLRKVFHHLFDNAIKFTPKGMISYGYRINGTQLEFHIQDSGIGISENNIIRAFDSFSQLEFVNTRFFEGSGLGLSIVKGLIEIMDGTIRVESVKDMGSKFIFTLPFEPVN